MSNAELSFDDLMRFDKPTAVPAASEVNPGPRRRLRAVEPEETTFPAGHVAEGFEGAESDSFDELFGLTGLDSTDLQIVDLQVTEKPVAVASPVAAVPAAPAVPEAAPISPRRAAAAEREAAERAVAEREAAEREAAERAAAERVAAERSAIEPAAEPATTPTVEAPMAAPASRVRASASERRGEFYRRDLHSGWTRFRENLAVRITGWTVLVGATGVLVVFAIERF
ncbi:hypothetical protein N1031_19570 [Herbiconiux moechotypicola]|uniref:Translation initiation factor IF-2 n=1 Tax=Herbiconiux moechotypicola TaxID=637393 RepID=A0ABN3E6P3_9MICO|nr:hypothetical protein [Herbiconiux moechotypicola]MCS5731962.1 hypothetical protein [Herbiconiux moechotypicola]